jgi:hypothetical protein
VGTGGGDLSRLSQRLRDAGTQGQGLRRKLHAKLKTAADPVAKEIGETAHMDPYMPDRYAAVLAKDLEVKVLSSLSGDPKVTIRARPVEHKRKIAQINQGVIVHPVFAQGRRKTWNWKNGRQVKGMRPGFFSDPCKNSEPDVREKLLEALRETSDQIRGA